MSKASKRLARVQPNEVMPDLMRAVDYVRNTPPVEFKPKYPTYPIEWAVEPRYIEPTREYDKSCPLCGNLLHLRVTKTCYPYAFCSHCNQSFRPQTV